MKKRQEAGSLTPPTTKQPCVALHTSCLLVTLY